MTLSLEQLGRAVVAARELVLPEAILVDDRSSRGKREQNRENGYRWDEIGGYIVSTIRLPALFAGAAGPQYETLVYARAAGTWDADGSGVQTQIQADADAAHDAACERMRRRIQ